MVFLKKKFVKNSCIFFILSFASCSYADDNSVNSNDPCTVYLCLAGKLQGANPSECSAPVNKFFRIISKKHGRFNSGRTKNSRANFLSQCPSMDRGIYNKIIERFGSGRWG